MNQIKLVTKLWSRTVVLNLFQVTEPLNINYHLEEPKLSNDYNLLHYKEPSKWLTEPGFKATRVESKTSLSEGWARLRNLESWYTNPT